MNSPSLAFRLLLMVLGCSCASAPTLPKADSNLTRRAQGLVAGVADLLDVEPAVVSAAWDEDGLLEDLPGTGGFCSRRGAEQDRIILVDPTVEAGSVDGVLVHEIVHWLLEERQMSPFVEEGVAETAAMILEPNANRHTSLMRLVAGAGVDTNWVWQIEDTDELASLPSERKELFYALAYDYVARGGETGLRALPTPPMFSEPTGTSARVMFLDENGQQVGDVQTVPSDGTLHVPQGAKSAVLVGEEVPKK